MTAIGAITVLAGGHSGAAKSRVPRVEKSSNCAHSHDEFRDSAMPVEQRGLARRGGLSQCETGQSAPLWYGARLQAPFVAQILGQLLGTPGGAARPAYRQDAIPMALIVDRIA